MPVSAILDAYTAGHRIFGENRVQELISKQAELPPDIEWHFVGHLQTNKVKTLVGKSRLIHSIDSQRLLQVLDHESQKSGVVSDCLLQFHIAIEETKYGFSFDEACSMLGSEDFSTLKSVRIRGVMGMATYTDNPVRIRDEFRNLKWNFNELKSRFFNSVNYFTEISMGMSGDFRIALEEGATIVRIGSLIFGEREKKA
jgi:pyridoxal phosphate enzyme (YggS family)